MATSGTVFTSHGEPNRVGTLGSHHTAYPCWDPVATVRFYRDILGFPLIHAIPAQGWGKQNNPDMVHFFFDVGNGDTLAFFYYFGWERPEPPPAVLRQANHVAIEVPTLEALLEFREKLTDAGHDVMTIEHETIESIYVDDPNGLFFEMTTPTREFVPLDVSDAERTMTALEAALGEGATSIHDVWRAKARLNSPVGGAAVHVVDVPEWQPAVEAAANAGIAIERRDGYVVLHHPEAIELHRKDTGLYQAVWFTLPAGGLEGRITQFDRELLRVEA